MKLVINPAIWVTGVLYLTVNITVFAYLKAMITGYEWVIVDKPDASEAASRSRAHSVT